MHWESGLPKPMQAPFLSSARAASAGPDSQGDMPRQTGICCPCRGKSWTPYLQFLHEMKVLDLCMFLILHKGCNFNLCKHKHTKGILPECPPDVPNRGWAPALHPGSTDIPLDPSGDHCPRSRRAGDVPSSPAMERGKGSSWLSWLLQYFCWVHGGSIETLLAPRTQSSVY